MFRHGVRLLIAGLVFAGATGVALAQAVTPRLPKSDYTTDSMVNVKAAASKASDACTVQDFMAHRAAVVAEADKATAAAGKALKDTQAGRDLAAKNDVPKEELKRLDDIITGLRADVAEWADYGARARRWNFYRALNCPKAARTASAVRTPRNGAAAATAAARSTDTLLAAASIFASIAIEGGTGKDNINSGITSGNPSSESQGGSVSPASVAFNARLAMMMAQRFAVVVGVNYMINASNTLRFAQNHDPNPPAIDTFVTMNYNRAVATYVGMMMYWPMWLPKSPEMNSARTFSTLFYAGLVYGWFDLAMTTDEAGNVRSSAQSFRQSGLRLGMEVDIPLLLATTAYTYYAMEPFFRMGVSADMFGAFTLGHQAVFNAYAATIDPQTFWRFYFGIGVKINPPPPPV